MQFNEQAMKSIVENDRYFSFLFKDLGGKNPNLTDIELLEIIYNSEIIEDGFLFSIYEDELNKIL